MSETGRGPVQTPLRPHPDRCPLRLAKPVPRQPPQRARRSQRSGSSATPPSQPSTMSARKSLRRTWTCGREPAGGTTATSYLRRRPRCAAHRRRHDLRSGPSGDRGLLLQSGRRVPPNDSRGRTRVRRGQGGQRDRYSGDSLLWTKLDDVTQGIFQPHDETPERGGRRWSDGGCRCARFQTFCGRSCRLGRSRPEITAILRISNSTVGS